MYHPTLEDWEKEGQTPTEETLYALLMAHDSYVDWPRPYRLWIIFADNAAERISKARWRIACGKPFPPQR